MLDESEDSDRKENLADKGIYIFLFTVYVKYVKQRTWLEDV